MKVNEMAQCLVALGLMFMLICLGMGGCTYLVNRGEALIHQPKVNPAK